MKNVKSFTEDNVEFFAWAGLANRCLIDYSNGKLLVFLVNSYAFDESSSVGQIFLRLIQKFKPLILN